MEAIKRILVRLAVAHEKRVLFKAEKLKLKKKDQIRKHRKDLYESSSNPVG